MELSTTVLTNAGTLVTEAPFTYDEPKEHTPFIEANTVEATLQEVKQGHIIPVFVKDNEPVISHSEFVEAAQQVVTTCFYGETFLAPALRLSHPIKGRVPDARNKPASELKESEKTLYYERMAFVLEVPSISKQVGGNRLSLMVGGVKAYNLDNLYNKKGAPETFKVFIGFQNKVCCNLCVWTDGYLSDLKVRSLEELKEGITGLVTGYDAERHLYALESFNDYHLTEEQFARLIGRCRMYQHLPSRERSNVNPLLFGDNQLGAVVRDYYRDKSFCKDSVGNISLWRLYNLFTGSCKSTYIDSFLDRSSNAYEFVEEIRQSLVSQKANWFVN